MTSKYVSNDSVSLSAKKFIVCENNSMNVLHVPLFSREATRLTPGPFCPLATEMRRRDSPLLAEKLLRIDKKKSTDAFLSVWTRVSEMSNRAALIPVCRAAQFVSRADAPVGVGSNRAYASSLLFFSYRHQFIVHVAINVNMPNLYLHVCLK